MHRPTNSANTPRVRTSAAQTLRIIVLGYVVRGPLGGMVWSNLQFLNGLLRLGHDVYFVEDSDDYPSCYDPTRHITDTNPNYGLGFAAKTFERIGMSGRWAYHDAHTARWLGPCADGMVKLCREADLVINLCGVNPLRPWLLDIPVRVLVDEDPAFTQIRHLTNPSAREAAALHNAFFTFAENMGSERCTVPNDGFAWRATRQPLVIDMIAATPGPRQGAFTTVMQWDSYPAREHAGRRYGMKSDSFAPYVDLPQRLQERLELALGGAAAPRDLLRENGWSVIDPLAPTRDPWTYQNYIAASKAEFSVAKQGYVVTRSGWFSERSVTYLASGRPVVVEEAGFSDWLPTGIGVVPFSSPAEAIAGLEDVASRYELHCRAARNLAEEYFDSRKLLPQLIEGAYAAVNAATPSKPGQD